MSGAEIEKYDAVEAEIYGSYDKYVKDGKVAVLISPGYGAGWSTWAGHSSEAAVFDRELVEAVLVGDSARIAEVVTRKFPGVCTGGVYQLQVEWVPIGERFQITEYDGNEDLEILGPDWGYRA